MTPKQLAHAAGKKARHWGASIRSCPYGKHGALAQAWMTGWRSREMKDVSTTTALHVVRSEGQAPAQVECRGQGDNSRGQALLEGAGVSFPLDYIKAA